MAKTLIELQKELARLEKRHGVGRFVIDQAANVVKKKGASTVKGSDIAALGQDVWAAHKKASEDKARGVIPPGGRR